MQKYGNMNKELLLHRVAHIRNNSLIQDQMTLEEQYNLGAHTIIMNNNDQFTMTRNINSKNVITGYKANPEEKEEGLHEHFAHGIGGLLGLDFLMMLEHGREASKSLNAGQTVKYNLNNNIDPATGLPYNNKKMANIDFKLKDYRTRIAEVNKEVRSGNKKRNDIKKLKGL